jgi:hypothetical protein
MVRSQRNSERLAVKPPIGDDDDPWRWPKFGVSD